MQKQRVIACRYCQGEFSLMMDEDDDSPVMFCDNDCLSSYVTGVQVEAEIAK